MSARIMPVEKVPLPKSRTIQYWGRCSGAIGNHHPYKMVAAGKIRSRLKTDRYRGVTVISLLSLPSKFLIIRQVSVSEFKGLWQLSKIISLFQFLPSTLNIIINAFALLLMFGQNRNSLGSRLVSTTLGKVSLHSVI